MRFDSHNDDPSVQFCLFIDVVCWVEDMVPIGHDFTASNRSIEKVMKARREAFFLVLRYVKPIPNVLFCRCSICSTEYRDIIYLMAQIFVSFTCKQLCRKEQRQNRVSDISLRLMTFIILPSAVQYS